MESSILINLYSILGPMLDLALVSYFVKIGPILNELAGSEFIKKSYARFFLFLFFCIRVTGAVYDEYFVLSLVTVSILKPIFIIFLLYTYIRFRLKEERESNDNLSK